MEKWPSRSKRIEEQINESETYPTPIVRSPTKTQAKTLQHVCSGPSINLCRLHDCSLRLVNTHEPSVVVSEVQDFTVSLIPLIPTTPPTPLSYVSSLSFVCCLALGLCICSPQLLMKPLSYFEVGWSREFSKVSLEIISSLFPFVFGNHVRLYTWSLKHSHTASQSWTFDCGKLTPPWFSLVHLFQTRDKLQLL